MTIRKALVNVPLTQYQSFIFPLKQISQVSPLQSSRPIYLRPEVSDRGPATILRLCGTSSIGGHEDAPSEYGRLPCLGYCGPPSGFIGQEDEPSPSRRYLEGNGVIGTEGEKGSGLRAHQPRRGPGDARPLAISWGLARLCRTICSFLALFAPLSFSHLFYQLPRHHLLYTVSFRSYWSLLIPTFSF